MMNANIKRHAYTDYTGKSYISQYGIPYQKMVSQCPNHHFDNRTIIRTNQPMQRPVQQNIIDDKGAWASAARKDNMYMAYAKNC